MKKIELLAPAGNLIKMRTAFMAGAQAVYLGLPDFSLRVRINDFNQKTISLAIKEARQQKKKVYLTLNILAHEKHLKKLKKYLPIIKKLKPDALIISDPGVLSLVKKYLPQVPVHLSTQANCTNSEAVKFWYQQGVKRIILGREVTLPEIKEIHKACPRMELEYFVHGAMCMAYSGRCFLSQEFLGRSANLGDCAQPCRWSYHLRAENHKQEFELVTEEHGSYLLNSKDLCLLPHLLLLVKAGITSFKIEGRAKSVYYQAVVSGIYARALDFLTKKDRKKEFKYLEKELKEKLVHRGYTTGFLLGKKGEQNIANSHLTISWEFCGQVVEYNQKKKLAYIEVHNTLKVGDEVEIIGPKYQVKKIKIKKLFLAENGEEISQAHGGGGRKIVCFPLSEKIEFLSVLRRILPL